MFAKWIEEHKTEIISSAQELLRIPSVGTEPNEENQPFGVHADQALKYMLKMGEEHGFATRNVDGFAGHIEFGGFQEYVGVLTHLDVVPAGNNWTYPSFGAEIHDGRIYARGALDDKGPAIAAFYAMLAVKESGQPLKRNVRLIMGLDEESDWRCMDHYFQKEPKPWGGFTPDADFPLIFAEKGILHLELRKSGVPGLSSPIVEIIGGERPNMVPDTCRATLRLMPDEQPKFADKLKAAADRLNIAFRLQIVDSSMAEIEVQGKAAHGSTPEYGVNAIQQLGCLLSEVLAPDPFLKFLSTMDIHGEELGIACKDDVTGRLTSNLGMIRLNSEAASLIFDIRYPVDQTSEKLVQLIQRVANRLSLSIDLKSDKAPLYVSKDSEVVRKLLEVYEEVTGSGGLPVSIGGGTYARAITNGVAFGPLFPGMQDVAHQKDEYIAIDHLLKITEIYAHAILRLAT